MALAEQSLRLPRDEFGETTGFGIDFGMSIIKVAYTEYQEDYLIIHLLTFDPTEKEKALEHLSQKLSDLPAKVAVCGAGCHTFRHDIKRALHVEVSNVIEYDCFVEGFRFLFGSGFSDLLIEPSSEAIAEARHIVKDTVEYYQRWNTYSGGTFLQLKSPQERCVRENGQGVRYPVLLCLTGTSSCAMLVNHDGTYTVLDVLTFTGTTFKGISSLLTGKQCYSGLMDMAEKGEAQRLTTTVTNLPRFQCKTVLQPSDLDTELTLFGQVHSTSVADYRQEDIVAGMLSATVQQLVNFYWLHAQLHEVDRVYFCGNFTSSTAVQQLVTKYFTAKSLHNYQGRFISHHFIQYGGSLGALGALIKTMNHQQK